MKDYNKQPVTIFKCPCIGNKFILAGNLQEKPTLQEKREYGKYISIGCVVIKIPLEQFLEEKWSYCSKHF